jgi:hypothetical protein
VRAGSGDRAVGRQGGSGRVTMRRNFTRSPRRDAEARRTAFQVEPSAPARRPSPATTPPSNDFGVGIQPVRRRGLSLTSACSAPPRAMQFTKSNSRLTRRRGERGERPSRKGLFAAAKKSLWDRGWRGDRAAAGISTPRAVLRASACLRGLRVKCSCRADGRSRALYRDDRDSSTPRCARRSE